jgi:AraC-like DNA-binding protein
VPLRQADANLLRTLEEHALTLMAGLDDNEPLPQRVKNALRLLLKDGLPRKERVAEKFNVTVRTLQRHLQLAGTSYQQILDELRQRTGRALPAAQRPGDTGYSQLPGLYRIALIPPQLQNLDRANAGRISRKQTQQLAPAGG